ncbi:hypothetical protein [Pigmentiphaga sp. CHJ604]|uniref:lipopolysaccharide biosynthesis protein n=1 Tax=Pigmentiphaga sp. CHJ604 TaxID=3081984 RepID=UPI0030CFEEA1
MIDQAWLSALNLALGLVLIRLATKEAYGIYAQLYVGALFVVSVSDSLIINPLTTRLNNGDSANRLPMISASSALQGRLALALSTLAGLGALAIGISHQQTDALATGVAFGAYVYVNAVREFRRGLRFLDHRPDLVLKTDLVYGFVLAALVAALVLADYVTLPSVMTALTLACIAAQAGRSRLPSPPQGEALRLLFQDIWRRGRLGLAGALASWVVNYSYLYAAALWLGVVATAELNASRLLLMPIMLGVVAWQRIALPLFSRQHANHDHSATRKLAMGSMLSMLISIGGYVSLLSLGLPWLTAHVLGPHYAGLEHLVLGWACYFAAFALRSICTTLLISADNYLPLLQTSLGGLIIMLAALAASLPSLGMVGAIFSVTLVEILGAAYLGAVYLGRHRQHTGA